MLGREKILHHVAAVLGDIWWAKFKIY